MNNKSTKSLQSRIVEEINSTYTSIQSYRNQSSNDVATNERKIQIVEHKLKALKMMLAKIDNGEQVVFDQRKLSK